MGITNTSKPTTSLVDTARVSSAETWAHISTTWAAEPRTWLACISLFTNATRQSSSVTNIAKPV